MSLKLTNDILQVSLDEPGSVYRDSRFDWTSQVSSVQHIRLGECMSRELLAPKARELGGRGLSSEFGIRKPLGYANIKKGSWFPKIGVGWLEREDEADYEFWRSYKNIDAAQWDAEPSKDGLSLVLRMDSGLRNSIHWQLIRRYSLKNNALVCTLELHNKGTLELRSDEYCHNFVGHARQHQYGKAKLVLSNGKISKPNDFVNPNQNLEFSPSSLFFTPGREGEFYAGPLASTLPANSWWELKNGEKRWMRESVDAEVTSVAVWGKAYVVSPELFVDFCLGSGQSKIWTRTWHFGD